MIPVISARFMKATSRMFSDSLRRRHRNIVFRAFVGKIGSSALEQLPGEIPQCVAVGVVVARVEDLNGHRRAARRLPVAAPTGDRKLPDVVLQLPFSEYVVPKAHVLDQFTLGVAQVGDQVVDFPPPRKSPSSRRL